MKKKFSKERFYKRRAYQLMALIDHSFTQARKMIDDAKDLSEILQTVRQKQYEQQQAELVGGTAVIYNERNKASPEQIVEIKNFFSNGVSVKIH